MEVIDEIEMQRRIRQILQGHLGTPQGIDLWWRSINKGLDNRRPIDCSIYEVYDYLLGTLQP